MYARFVSRAVISTVVLGAIASVTVGCKGGKKDGGEGPVGPEEEQTQITERLLPDEGLVQQEVDLDIDGLGVCGCYQDPVRANDPGVIDLRGRTAKANAAPAETGKAIHAKGIERYSGADRRFEGAGQGRRRQIEAVAHGAASSTVW